MIEKIIFIENELGLLIQERTRLEFERDRLLAEELKVLADAYVRKLWQAGLSVHQGIEAIKPYKKINPPAGRQRDS